MRGVIPFFLVVCIPGVAFAQSGWGQITLQNHTDQTLDLYIDGNYGCRALSNLTCTTQVREGAHLATAKAGDGQEASDEFDIESGESYTYTIDLEDE